jgi:single-strand DNA-binding protein
MAGSVNKVILVGNLGRDPEVRFSQAGNKIVNFSLATSERWKDKSSGEQREKTEWHRVVVFDERLADVAERYLKKGAKIYIEGQLQTRDYEKDGQKHYVTEVALQRFRGVLTMLDSRGGGGGDYESPGGASSGGDWGSKAASGSSSGSAGGGSGGGDLDDEIPF